jgi:glycine cleavage system pyridoxal-binding protein P
MIRAALLALGLMTLPAQAGEEIVSGLSQNRVAITANFDGSEILI